MRFPTLSRSATLGAVALAALTAAALPAHAQDELVLVEQGRPTLYENGGIGRAEQAAMRETARAWPLRMTFSERKDDEFAAGVRLRVTDRHGAPVLALDDAGPMTYAKLPPGTYRLTATDHGVTESREVTLDGRHGRDVNFHWTGAPQADWNGPSAGGAASAS